ncbi:MAG TPA: hypothetical protein VGH20_11125 [Myxococcales bacterium]|jgi:hypothetical protein
MGSPVNELSSKRLLAVCAFLACALTAAHAGAQTTLVVTGNVVIQGGGTNTSTVRFTGNSTISAGSVNQTFSLSPSFPTLVIRGNGVFGDSCKVPGDCWDSNLCQEGVAPTLTTPGVAGVCGFSGIEEPSTCGDQTALNAKLDDCAKLWFDESNDGTFFANLTSRSESCASTGGSIAALNANCPATTYKNAYNRVIDSVVTAALTRIPTTTPFNQATAQGQIQIIGDWYKGFRQFNPSSGGAANDALVWNKTSTYLGEFWKSVYAAAGVPQAGSATPSSAALDNIFQQTLEADRTVLLAALTNVPNSSQLPLSGAPLIEVLGDALQMATDRLGTVGYYQDLGCRFRGDTGASATPSCRNGALRTEPAELTRLVASVSDPALLSAALTSPDTSSLFSTETWTNWRVVFSDWNSNSAAISAAVVDSVPGSTVYTPDLLVPTPASKFAATPPTEGLANIVQRAQTRIANFDASGLFDASTVGVLHGGLTSDRINGFITDATNAGNTLSSQVSSYTTNRTTLATNIIGQLANVTQQQDIVDQIDARSLQLQALAADVAGLQSAIQTEQAQYADFDAAYKTMSSFNTDPGTAVQHQTFTVSAVPADAKWASATAVMAPTTPIASFAKTATPFAIAHPGDVVHVSTTGQWSPTCALSTAPFGSQPPPGGVSSVIDVSHAQTGPEGFVLQLNNGAYSAVANSAAHQTSSFTTDTSTTTTCGGASASIGGPLPLGLPIDISLGFSSNVNFCSSHATGTDIRDTQGTTNTSSSDSRLSANFTTGIRLSSTPFPTFPAGSLLLLEVKTGGTTRADLIDAHVLQEPASAVVIGATDLNGAAVTGVDLYLAVNDLHCAVNDPAALTVTAVQTTPFGATAQALGKGMSTALSNLRSQMPALLAQGVIGPEQMTALRAAAYDTLRTSCNATGANCTLSFYPPEIQTFFDGWIAQELAHLERASQLQADQRQFAVMQLQAKQLADDLNGAQAAARLYQTIPDHILADLGTELLQSDSQELRDVMVSEVFPIVDLKYPGALAVFDSSVLGQLVGVGTLPHLDWAGDLTTWSRAVASTTTEITNKVTQTVLNQPPPVDAILALGFPNPANPSLSGGWTQVSALRAQDLWNQLNDPTSNLLALQMLPTDIWQASGGTDALLCSDSLPVITAMEVFMVRPGLPDKYQGVRMPMVLDNNMHFYAQGADKVYRLENSDWLSQGIEIQAGEATDAFTDFAQKSASTASPLYVAGNGLSPFTKFTIDKTQLVSQPAGVPAPVSGASELVVFFRVSARNSPVHLTPMCP